MKQLIYSICKIIINLLVIVGFVVLMIHVFGK